MMLSLRFAHRLSKSHREVKGSDCLLTEDPKTKELQKANGSEAFTE